MNDDTLAGIRVLDFTTIVSGPYCTRMLADLGAEVIKMEPPEGDYIRTQQPIRDGRSAYFAHLNCGKKSIAVDLKRPGAADLMRELADQCDIVIENSRPGVMKRLGLDYPPLAERNPRLIYCSISGFGQSGPWATFSGGTCAFGTIQVALFKRERTGRGEYIDLAMMDAMLGMLIFEFQEAQFPIARTARGFPPTRTHDGWMMIVFVKPNNFEAAARAIGHPEWIADPRFNTIGAWLSHWDELMAMVGEWAANHTSDECEAILDEAGVPCSPYYTVREALALPHLAQRASFETIDDGSRPIRVPNRALRVNGSAARARGGMLALGADAEEILSAMLDYSTGRIAELRGRG
jgi:CoA:oxalate CoA-transferase